jgi:hypothetical protein
VKFFSDDDKGVAAAAGVIFYAAANNRDKSDDFGIVYGEFSKKVKSGNFGPRFHAGIYGTMSYADNTAGFGADEKLAAFAKQEQSTACVGQIHFANPR